MLDVVAVVGPLCSFFKQAQTTTSSRAHVVLASGLNNYLVRHDVCVRGIADPTQWTRPVQSSWAEKKVQRRRAAYRDNITTAFLFCICDLLCLLQPARSNLQPRIVIAILKFPGLRTKRRHQHTKHTNTSSWITEPRSSPRRSSRDAAMASVLPARSTMPSPVKTTTHGDAPLTQSRETGDVNPESRQGDPIVNRDKASSFAKSWSHMVAGGYVHPRGNDSCKRQPY